MYNSKYHSINVELAINYGVIGALILNRFINFTYCNKVNGRISMDGAIWIEDCLEKMYEQIPYITKEEIRQEFFDLHDEGCFTFAEGIKEKDITDRYLFKATLSGSCLEYLKKDQFERRK